MYKIKNTFKLALLSLLLLALSACGGGKRVVTQDDSADYESATSLPPLKKPSVAPNVASEPRLDEVERTAEAQDIVEEEVNNKPTQLAEEFVEPDVVTSAAIPDEVAGETVQEPTIEATPESIVEQSPDAQLISAQVISGESNNSRLEIDAGFDSSWSYLSRNLKSSDVTVFSRNKSAGRFSIGCGAMESGATVTKKGGWSIFNRSKQKRTEYCALSVVERRGKTLVFVLNRDGREVSDEYSSPLFARILNN